MILLVDNHDSFTFNLAHLLAEVSGIEPVVVRPEEVERAGILRRLADGEFDHVVIGPGPGSPHNDKDFKTAGQVIDASNKLPARGVPGPPRPRVTSRCPVADHSAPSRHRQPNSSLQARNLRRITARFRGNSVSLTVLDHVG